MGRHYCDYCDILLTHDSTSVRKAHNSGRNHLQNVRDHFMNLDPAVCNEIVTNVAAQYDREGKQKPPALMQGGPGFGPGMGGGFGGYPGGGMTFGQGPMSGGFRPGPYGQPPPRFGGPFNGGMGGPPPPLGMGGPQFGGPPPAFNRPPPPLGMAGAGGPPPPLGMVNRPPPNFNVPPPGFGGR